MKLYIVLLVIYIKLITAEETVDIRAYTLNSNVNFFLQLVPHMAVQVRTCDNIYKFCTLASYGKAKNGKYIHLIS